MDSLPTPAAHEFLSSVSRIPKKKELPQAPALDEEAPEEPHVNRPNTRGLAGLFGRDYN